MIRTNCAASENIREKILFAQTLARTAKVMQTAAVTAEVKQTVAGTSEGIFRSSWLFAGSDRIPQA